MATTKTKTKRPLTSNKTAVQADEKKPLTSIKTAAQADGKKEDWKSIAEVRMLLYVIPVGIVIALISYFLSQLPR